MKQPNHALLYLSLLLLSACGASGAPPTSKTLGTFRTAQSCEEIKNYVQDFANRSKQNPGGIVPVQTEGFAREQPTSAASPETDSGAQGGTVTQSDIAFSDPSRGLLYAFDHSNHLKILKVTPSSEVQLISSHDLGFFPTELVTVQFGDRQYAVVFGGSGNGIIGIPVPLGGAEAAIAPEPPYEEPKAVMALLDVTQPNQPKELKRETAPGYFLEARSLDAQGAVVWAIQQYIPIYLESLDDSQIFPEKTVASPQGSSNSKLVPCEQTYLYENETLDATYSPYSLSSTVISLLDLKSADYQVHSQGIFSPAWRSLLAANPRHLFLAQNVDGSGRTDTELFQFDFHQDASGISLGASTQVPGNIPNQFFIDESNGVVRVFHHLQETFGGCIDCVLEGDAGVTPAAMKAQALTQTGNYVSTYRTSGSSLVLQGRFGPFEADEMPYASRFIGRIGCVITFLQIDPLTCFDLADPAKPVKMGELEIAGVSFHLESVADDLLLGIGQGAQNGSVVANLFDISNPAQPALASQLSLSNGADWAYSPVFHDHRALGKDGLLRNFGVPIESGNGSSVALFSVDAEQKKLASQGAISKTFPPEGPYDSFSRAFFFNDTIATLSFQNVEVFLRSNLSKIFGMAL